MELALLYTSDCFAGLELQRADKMAFPISSVVIRHGAETLMCVPQHKRVLIIHITKDISFTSEQSSKGP